MNIFRLPVGWQYLVNNTLGGTLDANNINTYDKLVQGCLATGAVCIIDVSLWGSGDSQVMWDQESNADQTIDS